jgi:FMN reductase
MTQLLVLLGSVTPPGRFSRALEAAMAALPGRVSDVDLSLIDLAGQRISFADGTPPDKLDDDTLHVVQALAGADAVLFASPVYRASMTGALKNLLDHVPVEALQGKACGIAAMGATTHHYLGVEGHLRDVLAWFGAVVAPTSAYLSSADFVDGAPTPAAIAALVELLETLARLGTTLTTAGMLGPAPLAARRA